MTTDHVGWPTVRLTDGHLAQMSMPWHHHSELSSCSLQTTRLSSSRPCQLALTLWQSSNWRWRRWLQCIRTLASFWFKALCKCTNCRSVVHGLSLTRSIKRQCRLSVSVLSGLAWWSIYCDMTLGNNKIIMSTAELVTIVVLLSMMTTQIDSQSQRGKMSLRK